MNARIRWVENLRNHIAELIQHGSQFYISGQFLTSLTNTENPKLTVEARSKLDDIIVNKFDAAIEGIGALSRIVSTIKLHLDADKPLHMELSKEIDDLAQIVGLLSSKKLDATGHDLFAEKMQRVTDKAQKIFRDEWRNL